WRSLPTAKVFPAAPFSRRSQNDLRITGEAYYDFVDRFVNAVKKELPDTLLQWEDFSKAHARPILDRYRDELVTFNDDIQGTAAVTAGAIFTAVRASGGRLRGHQVV